MTSKAQTPRGALLRAMDAPASDPTEAERQARLVLKNHPGEPEATILLAASRRRQGDPNEALALLTSLARQRPKEAKIHYELGLTLAESGRTELSIAAFRQVILLRPDIGSAWGRLGDQLFKAGQKAAADEAYARYFRAPPDDPSTAAAVRAIAGGKAEAAESPLRRRLMAWPHDVVALGLLADCLRQRSDFAAAASVLRSLLERHPSCTAARFTLADSLYKQGEHSEELVRHLQAVIATEPTNYRALGLLGMARLALNDATGAVEAFRAALIHAPDDPRFWVALGEALKFAGRPQEAKEAYLRAIAVAPEHGEAWFRLSDLKTYAFSYKEVAAMEAALESGPANAESRSLLHYAFAKARHDAGDPAEAFSHYAKGAALQRALAPYDATADEAILERGRTLFTPAFFAARSDGGAPDASAIFIVGMPRAGSTLLEQILASHPEVEGTHELFLIPRVALHLSTSSAEPYPSRLASLSPDERRALGEEAIAASRIHRRLGRPRFIDKQPVNFQHIGLIHLILPNARIVDIRRHPMASGFAMFRQHFGKGRDFSYDLVDIAAYYRRYLETMRIFDKSIPGRIYRVFYEDLVTDTEVEIRRLLDYCGLPFADSCLRFYQNRREIITPSAEQVRRPIYGDAVDEWRAYEPWLRPLREGLGPSLESWRD